jgi:hypothetical protein
VPGRAREGRVVTDDLGDLDSFDAADVGGCEGGAMSDTLIAFAAALVGGLFGSCVGFVLGYRTAKAMWKGAR